MTGFTKHQVVKLLPHACEFQQCWSPDSKLQTPGSRLQRRSRIFRASSPHALHQLTDGGSDRIRSGGGLPESDAWETSQEESAEWVRPLAPPHPWNTPWSHWKVLAINPICESSLSPHLPQAIPQAIPRGIPSGPPSSPRLGFLTTVQVWSRRTPDAASAAARDATDQIVCFRWLSEGVANARQA